MLSQPFLVYLLNLFNMNNTSDPDLKYDELPDDVVRFRPSKGPSQACEADQEKETEQVEGQAQKRKEVQEKETPSLCLY